VGLRGCSSIIDDEDPPRKCGSGARAGATAAALAALVSKRLIGTESFLRRKSESRNAQGTCVDCVSATTCDSSAVLGSAFPSFLVPPSLWARLPSLFAGCRFLPNIVRPLPHGCCTCTLNEARMFGCSALHFGPFLAGLVLAREDVTFITPKLASKAIAFIAYGARSTSNTQLTFEEYPPMP